MRPNQELGTCRRVMTLIVVGAAGMLAACNDKDGVDRDVKVMTLNAYYGFDVGPLLEASDPESIPVLATEAFLQLLSTDFAGRAEAMADKIAFENPHLIGLQEVALIRVQSPGDSVEGGTVAADTVLFDHLEILLAALAARGLDYRVAGSVENVDVEIPMLTGTDPLSFDDIRLTDYDVVLARADVEVSNVVAENYQALAFVPSLGLEIKRGYVALDARFADRTHRFVSTHLEDFPFEEVQLQQAQELAALVASEEKGVILVGDFNTPAPDGATYAFLTSQGFKDVWTGPGEGMTWGHDADLLNASPNLTLRIDLVLVRPPVAFKNLPTNPAQVDVWGDELDERTSSGLWPSDHAAVIAELPIR